MRVIGGAGMVGWLVGTAALLLGVEPLGTATLPETPQAKAASEWAIRLAAAQFRTASANSYACPAVWTSQPGALRRFNNSGASVIYKLYSATSLMAASAAESQEDAVPELAPGDPLFDTVFCDLNAPTFDAQGHPHFPIVDPRAYRGGRGTSVEGFAYGVGSPGTILPEETENPDNQRLPMPVKWIYLLADGHAAGTLDAQGHLVPLQNAPAGFDAYAQPTAENPIVSRVAFWADDASCRINVNTASEGVFWDTPRCDTTEERAYGKYQPAAHEHVRAMAHPAAVSLSSVLFPRQRLHLPQSPSSDLAALPLEKAHALWSLTPFLQAGGSEAGTVAPPDFAPTPAAETTDFYRSTDAYLAAVAARTSPDIDPDAVRFFLTTHSRAPEMNTLDNARISLWPVHVDPAKRTAFDEAALEATRIQREGDQGVMSYQRYDADYANSEFYGYGSSATRRNQWLFYYLHNMAYAGSNIPGASAVSGNLTRKYGSSTSDDSGWILLGALDYLRCANPVDPGLPAASRYAWHNGPSAPGFGQIVPIELGRDSDSHPQQFWTSFVSPRGFGRYSTLSEVTMWLGLATRTVGPPTYPGGGPGSTRHIYDHEAAFLLKGFCPAHGWPSYLPDFDVTLSSVPWRQEPTTGGALMTLNNAHILLPPNQETGYPSVTAHSKGALLPGMRAWGGTQGIRSFMDKPLPFHKWRIDTIFGASNEVFFSGGVNPQLAFAISRKNGSDPWQAILTDWPPFLSSLPSSPLGSLDSRFVQAQSIGGPVFDRADLAYSLVVPHGDPRLFGPVRLVGTNFMVGATNDLNIGLVATPWQVTERLHLNTWDPAFEQGELANPGTYHDSTGYLQQWFASYDRRSQPDFPYVPWSGRLIQRSSSSSGIWTSLATSDGGFEYGRRAWPDRGAFAPHLTGDFDNGVGPAPDGAYINMPDGGDVRAYSISGGTPYFDDLDQPWQENPSTFSPYRHMPSAVMLGSLPTGVSSQHPWQTLLFRPQPRLADGTPIAHYGAVAPGDRHFLDYFRMPIVTPWKMSDYGSTAGRINMNYQILPFSNIHRSTALHALLKPQKILAIPAAASDRYKSPGNTDQWRHHIDTAATLAPWEARFAEGRVFQQPSEICDQWLVPEGLPPSEADLDHRMAAFWAEHQLTGDNSKERPYANVYPHLTTRSQTFFLHIVAESIEKSPASPVDMFDPSQDRITGRVQRASYLERWLDPAHPDLWDGPAHVYDGSHSPELPWDMRVVDPEREPGVPSGLTVTPGAYDEWSGDRAVHVECDVSFGDVVEIQQSYDLVNWFPAVKQSVGLHPGSRPDRFSVDLPINFYYDSINGCYFRARSSAAP